MAPFLFVQKREIKSYHEKKKENYKIHTFAK